MSTDELDVLLDSDASARRTLDAFRESLDPDDTADDLDQALDRNLRDAMSAYDPDAVLPRTLALRLHGAGLDGGRLPDDALTDVLVPFRRELAAAAASGSDPGTLRLGLVGYERGSAVLYLAPAPDADVESSDGQDPPSLTSGADHLDNAVTVLNDLHTAAETEGDLLRFAGRADLVRGFAALADALDKHRLDLDVRWRAADGRHRDSTLTRRGREYARGYLERTERTEETTVTGRVVSLAINGTFGVKPSLRGGVVDVHTDGEQALLNLGLQLGQTVSVRVRRIETRDRLGNTGTTRHDLVGLAGEQETLPERP